MKTRIFFTTDIHGSDVVFRKFINSGKFYKADVIVVGGDITGKMVIPIEQMPNKKFRAQYMDTDVMLSDDTEMVEFEKKVKDSGFYPYRTSPEEMQELAKNPERVNDVFIGLMKQTLSNWLRLAEERLKGTNIKCYVQPGNDDPYPIDDVLNHYDFIIKTDRKVVEIGDRQMIGLGAANITPWKCPRDMPEEELEKILDSLASQLDDPSQAIFNLHCPPYDSTIDTAAQLDSTFKPIMGGGQPLMIPVGSKANRAAIEKYQPLLGLHGHIHESRGTFKIGSTLCLNPGSEYTEGILRGAVIELEGKKINSYVLTSG
jgi:Icc-related predicted phosphoesterase